MNDQQTKPSQPLRRRLPGTVLLLAVVGVLVVLLLWGTALRVQYHVWRLDNELGRAQSGSIDALVAIGRPAVPALRKALASQRQATRSAALKTLVRMDIPESRAALAELLDDDDGDVRFAAIYGLMGSDDEALLPAFRAALDDRRAGVRQMALYAMLAYPPPTALDELIGALTRGDEALQGEALSRLGDFPPDQVFERLFARLPDEPGLAPGIGELILRWTGDEIGAEPDELRQWWAVHKDELQPPEEATGEGEPDG